MKACIASGGRPNIPTYPGLDKVKYYTSDNIFNLMEFPKKMLVIGSGPIGCELGQGFARIGTEVTMISRGSQFLPNDDPQAAAMLQHQMQEDGVTIKFKTSPEEFFPGNDNKVGVRLSDGQNYEFDVVLIATGRRPNVEGMDCEAAGIKYDQKGIQVNNTLQTTNGDVFAIGDCIDGPKFTHNSDTHARMVIRNALFFGSLGKDKILLPYCTYTEPEIATVGLNEVLLHKKGIEYDVYSKSFEHMDRAICESKNGLYKIYCKKGTDQILGATLVGGPAGDLITHVTAAMTNNVSLSKLGVCVHPYPTYGEAFKGLADQFNRTKLKPSIKTLIRGLLDFK